MTRRIDPTDCDLDLADVKTYDFIGRADRMRLRSDRCHPLDAPPDTPQVPPDGTPTPPDVDRSTPPVLNLWNGEYILSCSDDSDGPPVGDPVLVPANTLVQAMDWRDVPDISTDRLAFIASLTEGQRALIRTLVESPFADVVGTIKSTYKLTTVQAQYLYTEVFNLLITLDNLVFVAAASQLDCNYWNTEQIVSCPLDPDGTGNPSLTPDVTVGADLFSSKTSQLDADNQAIAYGNSFLDCLYGNLEVSAACDGSDTDIPNLGLPDVIPNDTDTGQVGSVTVPADTVTSSEGSTAATSLAQSQAFALLDCFYLSTVLSKDCDALVGPGTVPGPVVDLEDTDGDPRGWSVTIPAGYLRSYISQQDAEDQATALADSLLNCYWENIIKTVNCPGGTSTVVPALGVYTATVAAGAFVSYVSQAVADDSAAALANSILNCIYGNPEKEVTCLTGSDDAGELLRALPYDVQNPVEGFSLSVAFRDQPLDDDNEYTVPAPFLPMVGQYFDVSDATQDVRIWFNYTDLTDGVDPQFGDNTAPSNPGRLVEVPILKATSLSGVASAAASVLNTDLDFGGASSTDEKVSLQVTGASDPYSAAGTGSLRASYIGPWTTPDHPTAVDSVTVLANSFVSYTSEDDASDLATATALSGLNCLWGNTEVEGGYSSGAGAGGAGLIPGADIDTLCSSGQASSNPGVDANLYSSNLGKHTANAMAKTMSDALVICEENQYDLQSELPEPACTIQYEMRHFNFNAFYPNPPTGLEVDICPGYLEGFLNTGLGGSIRWDTVVSGYIAPLAGGAPSALSTKVRFALPANLTMYVYVAYLVHPWYVRRSARWSHYVDTTYANGGPILHFSTLTPDSFSKSTFVAPRQIGRVVKHIGTVITNASTVTSLEQAHSGVITDAIQLK